jgi:N-acetylmuramoyl-L-alanine amidase
MIKLIIDPGHGGRDWGLRSGKRYNKGYDGCLEKDINMEVANRLSWFCAKHGLPYYMTRFGDRFVNLSDRCYRANNANCALFLSIHCNYARDQRIRGLETWHYKGSYSGSGWAKKCQLLLSRLKFTRDRGVKGGKFYVLKHTSMPAVLVELGFLSNREDCKYLNKEMNQELIAESLFEMVRRL